MKRDTEPENDRREREKDDAAQRLSDAESEDVKALESLLDRDGPRR